MNDFYLHPHYTYIIFFLVALNIIYLTGHFLSLPFKFSTNVIQHRPFFKLILGTLPFILFPALVYTHVNTILIGFLIPIFFLLKSNPPSRFERKLFDKKELLKINSIALPVIMIQFLLFSQFGKWNLLPIDVNNYSEIIFHMKNGFESKYGALNSLFPTNVPKRTPYHYPELWLTSSFVSIFPKLKIGYSLIYIAYPLLLTIYLTGIVSIFNRYKFIYKLGFSFSLLFIGVIDLKIFRELFDVGNLLSINTVIFENVGFFFNTLPFSYHGQKHLTFYIIAILFLILLKKTSKEKAYIILAFTPLLNIGLLPGIMGGLVIVSTIDYIKNREFRTLLTNILPISLVVLFILIYYKINGGYDIEKQTSINTLSSTLNLKGELIKIILKFIYTIFWLIITYGTYFLISFKNKQNILDNKKAITFSFVCLFVGVCTRPFIEGFNSAQFLTYILPLLNVTIIIILINSIESNKKWIACIIIFTSILISSINFSKTYQNCKTRREISINKIQDSSFTMKAVSILSTYKNPKIAYLLSDIDAKTIQPGYWYGYYPCEFILTLDYFNLYSLNYPYYKYPKNSLSSRFTNWNHQIYLLKNKKINAIQYEQHIFNFIKKYKIQIILTKQNSTIPFSVRKIINDSLVDSKTGDRILFVKS